MKRLITGLILTPFFFYVVALGPSWAFLISLAAVGLFCLYEYLGILAARFPEYESMQRNPALYAAGLFLLILPSGEGIFLTLLALLLMLLVLRMKDLAGALPMASGALLGVVYVFGSWRAGVLLRAMDPWWMLFACAINWLGDTFAYYAGSTFGKHKMAPRVSPAKSWEGAAASLAAGIVFGSAFIIYKFPSVGLGRAIVLCAAANIAGQMGDLAESAFKRGAGVKDSGNLLPGHGGWLDRVDSSLFSVPVVYWLLSQQWFIK
jgi:phosphatidate cytidylyltransferase